MPGLGHEQIPQLQDVDIRDDFHWEGRDELFIWMFR